MWLTKRATKHVFGTGTTVERLDARAPGYLPDLLAREVHADLDPTVAVHVSKATDRRRRLTNQARPPALQLRADHPGEVAPIVDRDTAGQPEPAGAE